MTNYDENFYADLQKEEEAQVKAEQVNTEEDYAGQYEDMRDQKEEREADRMEEYFTREPEIIWHTTFVFTLIK